jgi:hypothetical protein
VLSKYFETCEASPAFIAFTTSSNEGEIKEETVTNKTRESKNFFIIKFIG